ncbi:MAG: hypothetical protein ACYS6Z_01670 [Planctomycetota bacterium]|jgi:hypothetical protein
MLRLLPGLLILLSVALAEDEIRIERQDDAVIVRSPIAQGNFLFRAPPFFKEAEAEEPFAVHLSAKQRNAIAHVRLRLGQVTAGQARRGIDALVREKEAAYTAGYGKPKISGEGARRVVTTAGKAGMRMVVVVVDGPRLYELFLDHAPSDAVLSRQLEVVARGFTILDPKGAPVGGTPMGDDLEAGTIEHEYYRLTVFKPAGFAQEEVDPERDKGIFLHLRREDRYRNRCDIRIRVHLARAMKKTPAFKAQKAIERFVTRYQSAKAPKKPRRTSFAGAKNAWKFKMVGKEAKTSSVVEEEWRVIEHENGRVYEIQLTTSGGAAREFRKDIKAFWKKLKISSK